MATIAKRTRTSSLSSKDIHSVNKRTKNSVVTADSVPNPDRKNSKDSHDSGDSAICMKYKPGPPPPYSQDVSQQADEPECLPKVTESPASRYKYNPVPDRYHGVPPGHPLVTKPLMTQPGYPSRRSSIQARQPLTKFSLSKDWERSRYAREKGRSDIAPGPDTDMRHHKKFRNDGHNIRNLHDQDDHLAGLQYQSYTPFGLNVGGCFEETEEYQPLIIEDAYTVTMPRTMANPQGEQKYDSYTQGVAMHTNGLRYHVRVLEREDVGQGQYAQSSGDVRHQES